MSSLFSASVSCFFLSVSFLVAASEVEESITAVPGENVTLPCQAPSSSPVIVLEWTKDGLGEEYVLFYRDGQSNPENQRLSFKGRVQLKNRDMTDGDASLILKNVNIKDKGRYECHVIQSQAARRKRASFDTIPVRVINLNVREQGQEAGLTEDGGHEDGGHEDGGHEDGGDKREHLGLTVAMALTISAGFLLAVTFVILKTKLLNWTSNQPSSKNTVQQQLV